MNPNLKTLKSSTLAAFVLASVVVLNIPAWAQNNSPPAATATRPATAPAQQSSTPNNAPPATATQTTGEASRDPTIKKMNEEEKAKVNVEGK
jgi:hypothetical protein